MKKLLFVFGTRPEAIKLAPVIKEFQKQSDLFKIRICVTAQHREMLDQILDFFEIQSDFDLNIMRPNQSLLDVTYRSLKGLKSVLGRFMPDLMFVQGDTTTAFVGALAGFYEKIQVAHVEAGLRSKDKFSPFPEEINRVLVAQLADLHFPPTKAGKSNLMKEGVTSTKIHIVGNTIIDALLLTVEANKKHEKQYAQYFSWLDSTKRLILVTSHRRENFGQPLKSICLALQEIASQEDVEIVYPVHFNPNVRNVVFEVLKGQKNIHLIEPLSYPHLVWLMEKSFIVLTDSGGIQEEAPSLGKPVLVMRNVTERIEGIRAGTAKMVGTDKYTIVSETNKLLKNRQKYLLMSTKRNPYGDGLASKRIVSIVAKALA